MKGRKYSWSFCQRLKIDSLTEVDFSKIGADFGQAFLFELSGRVEIGIDARGEYL